MIELAAIVRLSLTYLAIYAARCAALLLAAFSHRLPGAPANRSAQAKSANEQH